MTDCRPAGPGFWPSHCLSDPPPATKALLPGVLPDMRDVLAGVLVISVAMMALTSCSHESAGGGGPCPGIPLVAASEAAADVATSCPPIVTVGERRYTLYGGLVGEHPGCVRRSLLGDVVAVGLNANGPYDYRARSIDGIFDESAIALALTRNAGRAGCAWDLYPRDDLSVDDANQIARRVTEPLRNDLN